MKTKPTVLHIDDERDLHLLVGDMLEVAGYDTLHAMSGPEALCLLEQFTPDIILLDLMMPGMNGFDFAQRLVERGLAPAVPILVLTALDVGFCLPEVQARLPGAQGFLGKPFMPDTLLQSIQDILEPRRVVAPADADLLEGAGNGRTSALRTTGGAAPAAN